MERNVDDFEQPTAADADGADEEAERQATPVNLMSGARGAAVAIAVSGLLVVGLWALARNAPSAGTDPRLVPVASPAAAPGRIDTQRFVTIIPGPSPAPVAASEETGAP